ncbi:GntR family transcriptional regulator [Novosphingobium flavum]|uniref:GntR family transcriptional regulator n=1 Tax=Novosphingobium flavum TaxID=1778672 RepID=A0A7X1KN30_9SPHN|nr:GntR family transcriptional regulator [Novosphingobium flavum]MBC2666988.1 GntR family transcriptional regulator [Novosphingobium flavum]
MAAADALLNRLREMILSGELLPGERITESSLADRLGVSRTPVRNVLSGLAAEGLIEPVGKRGFAVKAFSEDEALEALEIRAMLEGQAARKLARKGVKPDLLAQLNECLDEGDALFAKRFLNLEDEQEYGVMNARFHSLIVENCGSPILIGMIERLNNVPLVAPSVIVFDQIGLRKAYDILIRAHGHHHAIVEALRDRNEERVDMLFREHANQQRLSMFERRARLRIDAAG